ncbi:MAG: hypothetical protein ACK4J0_01325 [Candidatus Anstonellaceae archaeon]
MPNPIIFQLKTIKKAQTTIDLFLYFIVLLLVLEFTYLFLFTSLEIRIFKASGVRALSLALQASEDLYLSLSKTNNNFIFVGFLDEDKKDYSKQTYKNFNNIFYSFSKPEIDFSSNNQICIKRVLYSNSSNQEKNFWVCTQWG